jgi:hypothetical protein
MALLTISRLWATPARPPRESGGAQRNLEEHSATAPVLGAHDMHAPLAVVAGAAAARNDLEDLCLFAGTGVLDKMADVDDAFGAGVGSLVENDVVALIER